MHQTPPPPAPLRAVVRLLRLPVAPFNKGVLLLHLLTHAVAVGLRCGKADTEAMRSRVKLGSAFPRNSGGHSTFFLSR